MRKAGLFFLLLSLGLLLGCSSSERAELPSPPAGLLGNSDKIATGRQLFAAHCAECHGSIAEGRTQRAARFKPAAPDFQESGYRTALPGYIYLRIERGRKMEPFSSAGSVMPPWGAHLREEQIWSLVAYIRYRAAISLPE
jgi:mono/diheme cytochrome c family protein